MTIISSARIFTPRELSGLRAAVAGPVLTREDGAYEAECAVFNLRQAIRPSIAVGATETGDVAAAVRFAAEHGLAVGVQNAAHQTVIPEEGDDWMLITTRRMTDIVVDGRAATATVGAGVRWTDALSATAKHGLAPIVGSAPNVGIMGYTLGGGVSPLLGRSYGYAADHVLRMEVVTADGQVRDVASDTEPDLFWALRGCKGNFGIVTRMEFSLFPVTRFYGGGIYFSGDDSPELLRAWRTFVDTLGEETTTSVALMRLPNIPELPPVLRGEFVLHLRFAHLGTAAEGETLLAPLRAVATPLLDLVVERPFEQAGDIHMDPVDPLPTIDRGFCLRELTADTLDKLLELAGPEAGCSPLLMVEVRALGGAFDREPLVPNAVPSRGLPFLVFATGTAGSSDASALEASLDILAKELAPWADDRVSGNFVAPHDALTETGVQRVYGPDRYQRLAQIKREFDPANMFRINHNIRPS
ncbi:FAD-binding oxidoreductase [Streptomyces sp. NPDC058691]|uniref:FAD-binding oxidoreductase n=1 Tax=Streptomyces sp. NPDC058691 TaxID=3346601 RepID=UPI00365E764A